MAKGQTVDAIFYLGQMNRLAVQQSSVNKRYGRHDAGSTCAFPFCYLLLPTCIFFSVVSNRTIFILKIKSF